MVAVTADTYSVDELNSEIAQQPMLALIFDPMIDMETNSRSNVI